MAKIVNFSVSTESFWQKTSENTKTHLHKSTELR